jgi:hypothetical protein
MLSVDKGSGSHSAPCLIVYLLVWCRGPGPEAAAQMALGQEQHPQGGAAAHPALPPTQPPSRCRSHSAPGCATQSRWQRRYLLSVHVMCSSVAMRSLKSVTYREYVKVWAPLYCLCLSVASRCNMAAYASHVQIDITFAWDTALLGRTKRKPSLLALSEESCL